MSEFTPAKTIIDTAEYNYLLERSKPDKEGEVFLLKTCIAEMLNYKIEPAMFVEALKRQGIIFAARHPLSRANYTAEDIIVEKIKP